MSAVYFIFAVASSIVSVAMWLMPVFAVSPAFGIFNFIYGYGGLLTVALLALAFAPFAVAAEGCSVEAAFVRSVHIWARRPWESLKFFAVGYLVVTLPIGMLLALQSGIDRGSWLRTPFNVVEIAIYAVLVPLISLAMWEFYTTPP
jgi:hypothetical protein